MKIEIISRKLITASSETPPHLRNLKLSSFDQHAPNYYVVTIYYYPSDGDQEKAGSSNAAKSLELQKSLSEMLTLYYPLAGRFARDDPLLIECNAKGVEYVEALVSGNLSQLLADGELESRSQNHLAPQKFDPKGSSPLIIQVNMFECGGMAIVMSMTHKIADGFSAFTLINAWATACRIGTVKKVHRPSFELGSLFPPRDASIKAEDLVLIRAATNKIVTKRFVFHDVAISNLKAAANAGTGRGSDLLKHKLTRVKVVTALIWSAFIRVAKARHGRMRPSVLKVPVNLRGKTKLSIPENSFGNFRSWAVAEFTPSDESEVQLYELVNLIHDGIERTVSNYAKASSTDDLALMVIDDIWKVSEALKKSEVDVYLFSCWCRFPIYEPDFGWGKPTLMKRSVPVEKEMILLLDTKDGKGIEAWMSLEEKNMALFEQDPDILAFTC